MKQSYAHGTENVIVFQAIVYTKVCIIEKGRRGMMDAARDVNVMMFPQDYIAVRRGIHQMRCIFVIIHKTYTSYPIVKKIL